MREGRRSGLTGAHKYLISSVQYYLGLEGHAVEEFILDHLDVRSTFDWNTLELPVVIIHVAKHVWK